MNEEGLRMWFKKKDKKDEVKRELQKEEERFRRLLQAYEIRANEGGINNDVLIEADRYMEYAKVLFSIPGDYGITQTALTILWEAYVTLESGKITTPCLNLGYENLIKRARNLDRVRCYNCLNIYDSKSHKCTGCGAERF